MAELRRLAWVQIMQFLPVNRILREQETSLQHSICVSGLATGRSERGDAARHP
jgi:hypothetical protein